MELFFHGVFRGLWVFACPRYSRKNGYFSTQKAPAARVVLTATTAVAQLLLRDTHYLAFKEAELAAAAFPSSLTSAQENHLTQTQKRYLGALKELGRMRQLLKDSAQI